jgi:hypothetical protein
MGAYRTSYSRALFKNASSGFNARPLDADDIAFIESVRTHGCVGLNLGDVQRRLLSDDFPTYVSEEDACEAYGLQSAYLEVQSKEERALYFSIGSHAAQKERAEHQLLQARRRAAFLRAREEHRAQLAVLERINREEAKKKLKRELQDAEIEFDWAKIEREKIIKAASRDRRERRRALQAAEREMQRTQRVLRRIQRRLKDDDDSEGHAGHSRQDGGAVDAGGAEENLSLGSATANGSCAGDLGNAEGGDRGGASGASENSASHDRP